MNATQQIAGSLTDTQLAGFVNVIDLMMWVMPILVMATVIYTFTKRRRSLWDVITPMVGLLIAMSVMNIVIDDILPAWNENSEELRQQHTTIDLEAELERQHQLQRERQKSEETYNTTTQEEERRSFDSLEIFSTGDL